MSQRHESDHELYSADGNRDGPWCALCREPWPCFAHFQANRETASRFDQDPDLAEEMGYDE